MSDQNGAVRLEQLAGMAQETDADNPTAEQQQEQAEQAAKETAADQAARQWGMIMFTVGGFACMIAPELKPVYSEDRCFQWGQHANAVAEKYGWTGPSAMPELALMASTVGFAVPTYLMVSAKLKEAKEGGPSSWVAKLGLWWRTRRAAKAAPGAAAAGQGVPGGSQQ